MRHSLSCGAAERSCSCTPPSPCPNTGLSKHSDAVFPPPDPQPVARVPTPRGYRMHNDSPVRVACEWICRPPPPPRLMFQATVASVVGLTRDHVIYHRKWPRNAPSGAFRLFWPQKDADGELSPRPRVQELCAPDRRATRPRFGHLRAQRHRAGLRSSSSGPCRRRRPASFRCEGRLARGVGRVLRGRHLRWGPPPPSLAPPPRPPPRGSVKKFVPASMAFLSGTTGILPTLWVFAGWRPCCLIFAN